MAEGADPETYLRLIWEHLLLGDRQNNARQEGAEATVVSRALVAAGVLGHDRVQAIFDEYVLAMSLRQQMRGHMHMHHRNLARGQGTRLSAQRVAICDTEFKVGHESRTLERVLFADDATHLDLSGIGPPGQGGGRRRTAGMRMVRGVMGPVQPNPQILTVSDDHGATATARPSGSSWSDRSWQSSYTTDVPLSPDATWIEIDGTRFDLPERQSTPESHVEAVEPIDPLRAMLYREVLGTQHRHGPTDSIEIALEALVATGSLGEEDSLVADIRRIAGAVANATPVPDLPEPWASLLRRFSKTDGPSGSIAIGAAINSVDGYSIRFDSLVSEPTSFSLTLAVSPGAPLLMHFPGAALERSPIDWWAEDDKMNTYVLFSGGGGGSGELAEGDVHSLAPLDPKATVLRLLPTGEAERGVVTVPLSGLAGTS